MAAYQKKAVFIGAGPSAVGQAAFASHTLGWKVMFYAHPDHRIRFNKLAAAGKPNFTTDPEEAVAFADIISIHIRFDGLEDIFRHLKQFDMTNKIMILNNGFFGARICKHIMGDKAPTCILETSTSPVAAWPNNDDTGLELADVKRNLIIGLLERMPDNATKARIADLYGRGLKWVDSDVVGAFSIDNPLIYTVAVIFGAAAIGKRLSNFHLYKDAYCRPAVELRELLEDEVISLAKTAFGIDLTRQYKRMNEFYDFEFQNFEDFARHSPVHNRRTLLPTTFAHRFCQEDVSALLFFRKLANVFGTKTETMDWVQMSKQSLASQQNLES
ncbi:hypothetical protein BDV96DRAFT_604385 [Lophiotrema nucula]|uniref:Opine dehydrogenase domain-containing protein n=1 Tax=Lophiotrema nucula TaxID=690887 RepID=A0A6A5YSC1_9PLEO|nr:hypothetical protein BDV96DRAFT_604385 [Lophiotrema nucula]